MNGEGFAYFRWHQLSIGFSFSDITACRDFGCLGKWRRLNPKGAK